MQEIKEKPKLGKAKEKPKSMLLPKQAVHMMKEKYIKEMDQRPKGAEGSTQQAPDQVEHAGRWAADELAGRAVEQGRGLAKRQFAANRGKAQAAPGHIPPEEGPSMEGAPEGHHAPERPPAAPRERPVTEHPPTAPKERPQAEHTANPIKERQTVEARTDRQGRSRPYCAAQGTRAGQGQ